MDGSNRWRDGLVNKSIDRKDGLMGEEPVKEMDRQILGTTEGTGAGEETEKGLDEWKNKFIE